MHFSFTSLLLHSTSVQRLMYFTVATLELHSSFTATSKHLYFTFSSLSFSTIIRVLTITSLALQNNFTRTFYHSNFTATLHCCFSQLHNNFSCTSLLLHKPSQQLHLHFCTASLHTLHLYFTVATLNFTTILHRLHFFFTVVSLKFTTTL